MRRMAAIAGFCLGLAAPALSQQTTEVFSACAPGDGAWIEKACFTESYAPPEYGHSVLGDTPEWTVLTVFHGPEASQAADGRRGWNGISSDVSHIFEDVAPRLADIDGDGRLEVITVQSSFDKGARLVVYAITPEPRPLAATPYIGQANRWLAPAGIADFDGDGRVEIAYVDRPHLRKDLVFVRLDGDQLVETLRLPGLTNHRIGDDFISGGVRDCGQGAELILASPDWSRLMRVLNGTVTDIGSMPPEGLSVPPC